MHNQEQHKVLPCDSKTLITSKLLPAHALDPRILQQLTNIPILGEVSFDGHIEEINEGCGKKFRQNPLETLAF
jgi:hypothetical protein